MTYVDDELRNPLTPSQLIIGRRLLSSERKTGGPPSTAPQTGSELSKRAKYLTTVLSQFWRRWQKEYLTELRVHHNFANRRTDSQPSKLETSFAFTWTRRQDNFGTWELLNPSLRDEMDFIEELWREHVVVIESSR